MSGEDDKQTETPETTATAGTTDGASETASAAGPKAAEAQTSGAPTGGITDALRRAFTDYLDKSGAREKYGDEVNVDLDFLREHAGPLFSSMFQQLTSNIVPKDMKVGVPTGAKAAGQDGPVAVNLDIGGIISSFFKPKGEAAGGAEAASKAPEAAEGPSKAPESKGDEPPKT
jgi:hypothetical protein